MRRVSKKRGRLNRAVASVRAEFREAFPFCMWPGCGLRATDLHELARGPARGKALSERAAWLHLCAAHHAECGDYSIGGLPTQLAVKRNADPFDYSRVAVNRLRGRQDDEITEAEVDAAWVELLARLAARGIAVI